MLMPLKRVDPFVIRVDNATGIVDVVPTFVGRADMPEVVTRYFLTHYVTVCERFSFATAESDYEECGAFHAAARNQAWLALWDRANPASPLNAFKDGSSVRAQVSAVSFFERGNGVADLAQVRYTKARRASSSANDQVTHWIATVQYVYGEPSKDPLARRWNPLGFKIVDFRSEPETLPMDAHGSHDSGLECRACTMNRFLVIVPLTLALVLLWASPSRAETVPVRGNVDSRIRTAAYDADEVYRLRGFVGYVIELILEDGETFAGKGGGDLEGVTIDAHANSVLLKPRAAIVATNLVIYSDRRAYRFDYSVEARPPNRFADDVVYAVRFLYPPRADSGPSVDAELERELALAKRRRRRTPTTGIAATGP